MAPKRKAGDAVADTKSEKKSIPAGKAGSLQGLKLIFTGTFESMDRKTSEATAKKYGAAIIPANKLAEVDMVVLGTRAGQKKLDEIEENGLKTINEDEFLEMIKTGDSAKEPEDDAGDDDEGAEDDEDEEIEEPAPKKTKKAAPKAATKAKAAPKKAAPKNEKATTVPEGKADAFKGLKLLFTGTFEIDRKTCEATAITYGATLAKKLQDADWIVLGTKPGPKKVTEINENGYSTMNEAEFFTSKHPQRMTFKPLY
ncbi:hypothetical protein M409DRAFT_56024 [Zasmidium cellare ATCC 36951]|uniref:BRCT domain-containing protein n=1 Tax=Zasmidium cellare ATCC 36951 TaxID=1080233 RepID=A0A6A6CEM8_ZASCE|nr:uncharacterized protein M409DRAFT_56024 [Zasmidium cellare ATCC 36951]KAF2165133.1 hypothetical protein M409DRAFT_56024 [Zasmidium cellare ATCC 36951]